MFRVIDASRRLISDKSLHPLDRGRGEIKETVQATEEDRVQGLVIRNKAAGGL